MIIAAQVFDGTYGKSAAGLRASFARADDSSWVTLAEAVTNGDGYIGDWGSRNLDRGLYRILLDSETYFAGLGSVVAYPEVAVIFRAENESAASLVQVILAPYWYSTYFGTTSTQSEYPR